MSKIVLDALAAPSRETVTYLPLESSSHYYHRIRLKDLSISSAVSFPSLFSLAEHGCDFVGMMSQSVSLGHVGMRATVFEEQPLH